MRSTGVDDLKAALRRSAWLIVTLTVVGAVSMVVVKQVQEPAFRAGAKIVLPQSDLAAALAGIQSTYVDPDRQDEAEQNLAKAPGLYQAAARATAGRFGDARDLRGVTSVDVSNNLVRFRATRPSADDAVRIANAVASAYPAWRSSVYGRTIDAAIAEITRLRAESGSDALTDQLQRLRVLRSLNDPRTLLVERTTGAEQITPRPLRDAVFGGVIGFVIGLLVAGLRELLDTRIRTEADVEEAVNAPVLATVQTIPRRARSRVMMADARFADVYALLAANLAQILEGEERPVCIAVTSAEPGEGKTTTSANLALALARRGQDVVLADFDLRKPALAPMFSLPADATGVADVLRGEVTVNASLWPVALGAVGAGRPRTTSGARTARRGGVRMAPPRVEGEGSLLLLPAGRPGSEGSGGDFSRLPKLLEALESIAEFVIIDTPPASLTAGVAELAQSVNALLVVVRPGVATRRRLHSLSSRGQVWGSKIVGAVLNGAAGEERYSSYYGSRP